MRTLATPLPAARASAPARFHLAPRVPGPARSPEPRARADTEARFGHDFSKVRVHEAPEAARMGPAHAGGARIDPAPGSPDPRAGGETLGHEPAPADARPSPEREADAGDARVAGGEAGAQEPSGPLRPLVLAGEAGAIQRKVEVHFTLATPQPMAQQVEKVDTGGTRPDWQKEHEELSGPGADIRHELAWDIIQKSMRKELKYKTVGEVRTLMQTAYGEDSNPTIRGVEAAVGRALTKLFLDKENLWKGELEDNQARGRLMAAMETRLKSAGVGAHLGALDPVLKVDASLLSVPTQPGDLLSNMLQSEEHTLPAAAVTPGALGTVKARFVGTTEKGLKLRLPMAGGGGTLETGAALLVPSAAGMDAYKVSRSFKHEKAAEVVNKGISPEYKHFGQLKLSSVEAMRRIYHQSLLDLRPEDKLGTKVDATKDATRDERIARALSSTIRLAPLGGVAASKDVAGPLGSTSTKDVRESGDLESAALSNFIAFFKDYKAGTGTATASGTKRKGAKRAKREEALDAAKDPLDALVLEFQAAAKANSMEDAEGAFERLKSVKHQVDVVGKRLPATDPDRMAIETELSGAPKATQDAEVKLTALRKAQKRKRGSS